MRYVALTHPTFREKSGLGRAICTFKAVSKNGWVYFCQLKQFLYSEKGECIIHIIICLYPLKNNPSLWQCAGNASHTTLILLSGTSIK